MRIALEMSPGVAFRIIAAIVKGRRATHEAETEMRVEPRSGEPVHPVRLAADQFSETPALKFSRG